MKDEAEKHGAVVGIEMPKPPKVGAADQTIPNGLGFIYIKFGAVGAATACRAALTGRSFNGQTVKVYYYPEPQFDAKELIDIGKPTLQ